MAGKPVLGLGAGSVDCRARDNVPDGAAVAQTAGKSGETDEVQHEGRNTRAAQQLDAQGTASADGRINNEGEHNQAAEQCARHDGQLEEG